MATCGPCDQRGLLRVGCCGLAHPHRGGQRTRSVRVYRPAEVNMARIDSVIVQQQRSAEKNCPYRVGFPIPAARAYLS